MSDRHSQQMEGKVAGHRCCMLRSLLAVTMPPCHDGSNRSVKAVSIPRRAYNSQHQPVAMRVRPKSSQRVVLRSIVAVYAAWCRTNVDVGHVLTRTRCAGNSCAANSAADESIPSHICSGLAFSCDRNFVLEKSAYISVICVEIGASLVARTNDQSCSDRWRFETRMYRKKRGEKSAIVTYASVRIRRAIRG